MLLTDEPEGPFVNNRNNESIFSIEDSVH